MIIIQTKKPDDLDVKIDAEQQKIMLKNFNEYTHPETKFMGRMMLLLLSLWGALAYLLYTKFSFDGFSISFTMIIIVMPSSYALSFSWLVRLARRAVVNRLGFIPGEPINCGEKYVLTASDCHDNSLFFKTFVGHVFKDEDGNLWSRSAESECQRYKKSLIETNKEVYFVDSYCTQRAYIWAIDLIEEGDR
jgi:hypothetical protein